MHSRAWWRRWRATWPGRGWGGCCRPAAASRDRATPNAWPKAATRSPSSAALQAGVMPTCRRARSTRANGYPSPPTSSAPPRGAAVRGEAAGRAMAESATVRRSRPRASRGGLDGHRTLTDSGNMKEAASSRTRLRDRVAHRDRRLRGEVDPAAWGRGVAARPQRHHFVISKTEKTRPASSTCSRPQAASELVTRPAARPMAARLRGASAPFAVVFGRGRFARGRRSTVLEAPAPRRTGCA